MSLVLTGTCGAASVVTLNRPGRLHAAGFALRDEPHAARVAAQAGLL
jgi:hypothetical protein